MYFVLILMNIASIYIYMYILYVYVSYKYVSQWFPRMTKNKKIPTNNNLRSIIKELNAPLVIYVLLSVVLLSVKPILSIIVEAEISQSEEHPHVTYVVVTLFDAQVRLDQLDVPLLLSYQLKQAYVVLAWPETRSGISISISLSVLDI